MTTMDNLSLLERATTTNIVAFPTAEDRAENNYRTRVVEWFKDANDAMATDVLSERTIYQVPTHITDGVQLIEATYTSRETIAADVMDNVAFVVSKRDNAGGAATIMAQHTTAAAGSGLTAFIAKPFTLATALADTQTGRGTLVTIEILKAMAGKIVGAGHLKLVFKEL